MTLTQKIALYARVSSQKQADENTIDSQLSALRQRIRQDNLQIAAEMEFCDNGYSGAELLRPALERLRDLVATSFIDRVYVHSPDRLSRKLAHQAILNEEFRKYGCAIQFLNHDGHSDSPESNLFFQMQGMFAEYEREKILERTRRGRKHSAAQGNVSVFSRAPYGYRYISKTQNEGQAKWEIDPIQSEHIRQIFHWVADCGCSLAEVARRLYANSIPTARGNSSWDSATIRGILINPAYHGHAVYGKQRLVPRKPGKRAKRGDPEVPRQAKVPTATSQSEQVVISVPAIIDQSLFEKVRARMDENRKRRRERQTGGKYLLSGLMICGACGSAYCSQRSGGSRYFYYRCIGTDKHRCHGSSICDNTSVCGEEVESLIWKEVCILLQDPMRLRSEIERRRTAPSTLAKEIQALEKSVSVHQRTIDRLIDSYASGKIEKDEFDPRIDKARMECNRDRAALDSLKGQVPKAIDVDSVSKALASLAENLAAQLPDADWTLKRQLLRLLIERIEIHRDEVRIVYKVPPNPFALSPDSRGILQHWLRRAAVPFGTGPSVCCSVDAAVSADSSNTLRKRNAVRKNSSQH